jgi:hypothetical protein
VRDNGNAMTGPEHYAEAERILAEAKDCDPDADRADVALYLEFAKVHVALASKAPAEDLGAAIIEAHKVADRIEFQVDEDAPASERHYVDVWHSLTVKRGSGATPAEALGVAYAKLTAYLAERAS